MIDGLADTKCWAKRLLAFADFSTIYLYSQNLLLLAKLYLIPSLINQIETRLTLLLSTSSYYLSL